MKTKGKSNERFKFLYQVTPDSHKFFHDMETDRIAIADLSGYFPNQTEDGILYLDRTRQVELRANKNSHLIVPLEAPDGKKSRTPMTILATQYLMRVFNQQ